MLHTVCAFRDCEVQSLPQKRGNMVMHSTQSGLSDCLSSLNDSNVSLQLPLPNNTEPELRMSPCPVYMHGRKSLPRI